MSEQNHSFSSRLHASTPTTINSTRSNNMQVSLRNPLRAIVNKSASRTLSKFSQPRRLFSTETPPIPPTPAVPHVPPQPQYPFPSHHHYSSDCGRHGRSAALWGGLALFGVSTAALWSKNRCLKAKNKDLSRRLDFLEQQHLALSTDANQTIKDVSQLRDEMNGIWGKYLEFTETHRRKHGDRRGCHKSWKRRHQTSDGSTCGTSSDSGETNLQFGLGSSQFAHYNNTNHDDHLNSSPHDFFFIVDEGSVATDPHHQQYHQQFHDIYNHHYHQQPQTQLHNPIHFFNTTAFLPHEIVTQKPIVIDFDHSNTRNDVEWANDPCYQRKLQKLQRKMERKLHGHGKWGHHNWHHSRKPHHHHRHHHGRGSFDEDFAPFINDRVMQKFNKHRHRGHHHGHDVDATGFDLMPGDDIFFLHFYGGERLEDGAPLAPSPPQLAEPTASIPQQPTPAPLPTTVG